MSYFKFCFNSFHFRHTQMDTNITFIQDPFTTTQTIYHSHHQHHDTTVTCYNMDCIWDRARKNLVPVLRPLTFILCLIGILGIVGNIFVIVVFSRTRQKRTSTYLVLTLGIIDLIACSIVIPSTLLKEWLVEFKSDIVCKLAELLRNSAIISSAMILAAIAFDRFLLVYRNTSQDGNKHVTMAMILVTIVTGISLGVPPMLGVGVYMEYINGGVVNIKVCLTNDQLISNEGLLIYWQIITALFSVLIVTIIVLYTLIFIMVYRHTNRARVHNNMTSSVVTTKLPFKTTSVLPFVGLSSKSPTFLKPQTGDKEDKSTQRFLVSWKPADKFRRMFNNKVSEVNCNNDRNVVSIKVIKDSSDSTTSITDDVQQAAGTSKLTNQHDSQDLLPSPENLCNLISKQNLGPKGTNRRVQSLGPRQTNPGESRLRQELLIRNQSAHIKTTKVLCIITTVYTIAFLPMFLITHRVIEANEIAFYLYFINNAANPIIYSFMNKKFRQDIWKMFSCSKSSIWQG